MSSSRSPSFGARLLAALASLKLSLFLFFTLAATSIFGTVIQQGGDPRELAAAYGPALAKLIAAFGLQDMYHSWWFELLLGLLLVNTLVCSARRLPATLRTLRRHQFQGADKLAARAGAASWEARPEAAAAVEEVLAQRFAAPRRRDAGGDTRWFAQKRPWARLGAYLAHASLVLFFLGGIVGARFGFKGTVNIVEGEAVSAIQLRSGEQLELPFEVACEDFELVTYPDGRPKDYLSRLVVRRDGRVVQEKTIEVNHPLIQDGIFFYQSSYGTSGGGTVLTAAGADGAVLLDRVRVPEGGATALPGTGLRLEVKASAPDYQGFGPAAQLALVDTAGGGHRHVGEPFVVLQNFPEFDRRRGGERVFRLDALLPGRAYTGLQVARDPGVPLVWAASVLLTLGTLLAFFANHRRVWVHLGDGRLTVAGLSARNRAAFAEELAELTAALRRRTDAAAADNDIPAAQCG